MRNYTPAARLAVNHHTLNLHSILAKLKIFIYDLRSRQALPPSIKLGPAPNKLGPALQTIGPAHQNARKAGNESRLPKRFGPALPAVHIVSKLGGAAMQIKKLIRSARQM